MTEEIMIDGVNVAGCNDFYKEWDNWSGKDNYRCQDFLSGVCAGNNCYYKQLKRLEQENKELKEYSQRMENQRENYYKEYNKLRSALEEIKNDLKEVCKEECDYTKPKFCGDCDCRYGQILNKINEVLDES